MNLAMSIILSGTGLPMHAVTLVTNGTGADGQGGRVISSG
jgi:hypothetical protein